MKTLMLTLWTLVLAGCQAGGSSGTSGNGDASEPAEELTAADHLPVIQRTETSSIGTIAGPAISGPAQCNRKYVISTFAGDSTVSITVKNLGRCEIRLQLVPPAMTGGAGSSAGTPPGTTITSPPGPGGALAQGMSTSITAASVSNGWVARVDCQGGGSRGCQWVWRIDKH